MVICKFFLQGTCKFGDNCKFEHQINSDHNYGSSILLQSYGNKPQMPASVDTTTLVKSVSNDMIGAEKGGQWLLSSYAPFKEKPAFPGFEDHSMEEMRFLYYEALKNGTLEQYKQNLQMMLQQAIIKIKSLQNPSPEIVAILKGIYDTPPSGSFSNNQSAGPTTSIFGGAQPQKSIFGGAPPNQNLFAGGNQTQQQSVFGGVKSSIFGGSQNTQPTNTVFGNTQQNNQTKSIFGVQQQPPAGNTSPLFSGNSIFGGGAQSNVFAKPQQTSPFGQAPQQSIFATNPPQQSVFQQNAPSTSPFGATPSAGSPFGTVPNATSPFGTTPATTPNATSPFGQQQSGAPNPSPFGQPQPTTVGQFAGPQAAVPPTQDNKPPAFQHSQSIFGNLGLQPTNSVFGNVVEQTKPNPEFYSKLEDLTEEEIKWFQSDDLDIMKIPEKPPTYEMCFKM